MFFGIDWITAFIKISFDIVFAIVTAIPFSMAWSTIAPVYFDFLPKAWVDVPYWHVVSFLLCSLYIGQMVSRITPSIVSVKVDNSNDNKKQ